MIETDSLILMPLTHGQLVKYIQDDDSLPKELNVLPTKKDISPALGKALENSVLPTVLDDDKNYKYHTLWIIISKPDNSIVGDITFVDEPDACGEIEIGYGTYESFRGRGIMTEAIAGVIDWAKMQPGVKSIFATTSKANISSYAILRKNRFEQVGEVGDMLSWKIKLK
ncbi:GNAT family N-acetyltransferase [Pedobacter sandarakinus]|uniref:GNAT family N-acetyltransferase n=1 Tax=Pedobacter sandarakinus TaxID=353156 RepID=UPI002246B16D|nr:GNAT family N-acetyltransferase [Pedobacter sandarakinus]MCX2573344.1 GNAT family N-acetyltransferase [Pedobacter sandarakinus]